MKRFVLVVISIMLCITIGISTFADAQQLGFKEKAYPIGYGRILSVDSVQHIVNYNGSELIVILTFYNNDSVSYVEVVGNLTYIELFNSFDNSSGISTFIYQFKFAEDGLLSYVMYMDGGGSERLLFNVTGTGFSYVETGLLDMYVEQWGYSTDEMEEISTIMNAVYPDSPEGHHDAVLDTMDDSRALRQGPTVFGFQMAFGLVMIFASPFSILWIVIIVMLFISSRRKEADILRKIDEEREDMDIDTEELAVASRIVKARSMATLASIKSIAPHLGVPAIIWRDIHKKYTTIASLLAAFDDSEFTEDGRIVGPIADSLTMWVRNSLTLEQRSRLEGTYRAPSVEDYVKALKRILQYSASNLHLPVYEQYIHALEKSNNWVMEIVKDLRPGGSGVFETRETIGRPDFSEMIDSVK